MYSVKFLSRDHVEAELKGSESINLRSIETSGESINSRSIETSGECIE